MILKKIIKNNFVLNNRIVVSPMCQYSSDNGSPSPWHYKHLGSLICSGAGMLVLESTAVNFEGRISNRDLCLYNKKHLLELKKLIIFLKSLNNIPICIQLSHAGRKGSSFVPWVKKNRPLNKTKRWDTISSSDIKKDNLWPKPKIATKRAIEKIVNDFCRSAKYAIDAGVDAIEIHMAHGYLIHQFLSPVSNKRTDEFGGTFEKRSALAIKIIKKIKKICKNKILLGARITGVDHLEDGIIAKEAIQLSIKLEKCGLDYICVSSGGIKTITNMKKNPGLERLKISKEIKKKTKKLIIGTTGNMGNLTQLKKSILKKKIDFAFIGRPFLKNPNWLLEYLYKNNKKILIPNQYIRGFQK